MANYKINIKAVVTEIYVFHTGEKNKNNTRTI